MEHTTFIEKISLWLDDELQPAEVTELRLHLAQCPACNEVYLAVRRADSLLRRAAAVMVEPEPGFSGRFETRLASYKPRRRWQVWLAVSVLLLGSFSLLAVGAVFGGMTLLNTWTLLLDVQILYYFLGELGQLVYQARAAVSLISSLLRIMAIVVTHPLFWVSLPLTAALAWLWLKMMNTPYPRIPTIVDTLV